MKYHQVSRKIMAYLSHPQTSGQGEIELQEYVSLKLNREPGTVGL
jgi:hypothetical protein